MCVRFANFVLLLPLLNSFSVRLCGAPPPRLHSLASDPGGWEGPWARPFTQSAPSGTASSRSRATATRAPSLRSPRRANGGVRGGGGGGGASARRRHPQSMNQNNARAHVRVVFRSSQLSDSIHNVCVCFARLPLRRPPLPRSTRPPTWTAWKPSTTTKGRANKSNVRVPLRVCVCVLWLAGVHDCPTKGCARCRQVYVVGWCSWGRGLGFARG